MLFLRGIGICSSFVNIGRSWFSYDTGKREEEFNPLEAVLQLVPVGEGSGHQGWFYSASQ